LAKCALLASTPSTSTPPRAQVMSDTMPANDECPENMALLGGEGTDDRSLGRMKEPGFLQTMDWKKFEEAALPYTKIYDPPQLKGAGQYAASLTDCCTHRSKVCSLSCAPWFQKRVHNLEYGLLSEPDAWFSRMLENENPNMPQFMKGMYWMEDNLAPEVVLTFQSMDWRPGGMQGYIMPRYNWTNDTSCWGTCCLVMNCTGTPNVAWPFTFSPDRKFININPQWIYVMQPGDQIHRPDGTPVEFEPGDMMRMAFHDNADPSSGLAYQYLVRRVAYMDDNGKLIKTKAYEELKRRALMPEPERKRGRCSCTCWGYTCPKPSEDDIPGMFTPLADKQMFQVAPRLEQMWPDVSFPSA